MPASHLLACNNYRYALNWSYNRLNNLIYAGNNNDLNCAAMMSPVVYGAQIITIFITYCISPMWAAILPLLALSLSFTLTLLPSSCFVTKPKDDEKERGRCPKQKCNGNTNVSQMWLVSEYKSNTHTRWPLQAATTSRILASYWLIINISDC